MAVVIKLDPNKFGHAAYATPMTTPPIMSEEAYNAFLNEIYEQILLQNFKTYYENQTDETVSGRITLFVLDSLIKKYYIDTKSLNLDTFRLEQEEFYKKAEEIRIDEEETH